MVSSRQVTLEQFMADLGRERYWARVHAKGRNKHTSDTTSGRYLLREAADKVAVAVEAWRKNARKGRAGKGAALEALLGKCASSVVAVIAVRATLDVACRGGVGQAAAAYSVGAALEEEMHFRALKKIAPTLWKDVRKRLKARKDRRRRTKLVKRIHEATKASFVPWSRSEKIALGLTLIEIVAQATGMVEITMLPLPKKRQRGVVSITEDTMNWLSKSHEAHESLCPFYLPTLDAPRPWENAFDGGYHTNLLLHKPLVKLFTKQHEDDVDRADMPEVYAAINTIQDTAWEINVEVYQVAKTFWDSGEPIADMVSAFKEEPPPRPDVDEKDKSIWRDYFADRGRWREAVNRNLSHRLLHSRVMFMADKFVGETFYFPHNADFRGRLYPIPFFLQPQGCSLARGLLQFSAATPIETESAREWFLIHGANCWGFDKVPFAARLAWVKENHEKILTVFKDPIDCRWWAEADKPWEFLAWCLEYGNMVATEAAGGVFWSKLPVSMDGSNNGLQIFSMLMRDSEGAAATNCSPSEAPRDIYQDVADLVTERLMKSSDPMAPQWLEFCGGRVPRAAVKRPVMTLPYGATFHSCTHYTHDWYKELERGGKTTPFTRGYKCSVFLARHVWDSIDAVVGPAKTCMDWLQTCAKLLAEAGKFVRWTSPTGFPVRQEYTRYENQVISTTVGEKVRRVRYRKDTVEPAAREHANGIAPNYVHSLDSAVLAKAVCMAKKKFGVTQFALVHDSYGVPAQDAAAMAACIRQAYVDVFSRPLLKELYAEFKAQAPDIDFPEPPEVGDFDVRQVLRSLYFFA